MPRISAVFPRPSRRPSGSGRLARERTARPRRDPPDTDHEKLGIAFTKTNVELCAAVNKALANIKKRGIFDALCRK